MDGIYRACLIATDYLANRGVSSEHTKTREICGQRVPMSDELTGTYHKFHRHHTPPTPAPYLIQRESPIQKPPTQSIKPSNLNNPAPNSPSVPSLPQPTPLQKKKASLTLQRPCVAQQRITLGAMTSFSDLQGRLQAQWVAKHIGDHPTGLAQFGGRELRPRFLAVGAWRLGTF